LAKKRSHPPLYRRVYEEGSKAANELLVMYFRPSQEGAKTVVSVSRRLGKAVLRNKVRRRIKEAMRSLLGTSKVPGEIILIARKRAASASYQEILQSLSELLTRMDLA